MIEIICSQLTLHIKTEQHSLISPFISTYCLMGTLAIS